MWLYILFNSKTPYTIGVKLTCRWAAHINSFQWSMKTFEHAYLPQYWELWKAIVCKITRLKTVLRLHTFLQWNFNTLFLQWNFNTLYYYLFYEIPFSCITAIRVFFEVQSSGYKSLVKCNMTCSECNKM